MGFGTNINIPRMNTGNMNGILRLLQESENLNPQQKFSMRPKTLQDLILFQQAGGNLGNIGGVPPGYWDWVRSQGSPGGGGFGFPQRKSSILGR